MKENLITQLCHHLNCAPQDLSSIFDFMNWENPNQKKAFDFLNTYKLCTTHLKINRLVKFDGLSLRKTKNLYAMRGYLGITVLQYYYARYGIKLNNFDLPCVCENGGNNHMSYYPMELLVALISIKSNGVN